MLFFAFMFAMGFPILILLDAVPKFTSFSTVKDASLIYFIQLIKFIFGIIVLTLSIMIVYNIIVYYNTICYLLSYFERRNANGCMKIF